MRRPTPTPRAGAKRPSIAPDLTAGYARILGGVGEAAKTRRLQELMNWPIQSAGADLMRLLTAIAATEAGIELAAPVHDGFWSSHRSIVSTPILSA